MVMFRTNQAIERYELNEIEERILRSIQENPFFSQKKIAEKLEEKYSTIKFYMEKMKKNDIIRREGSSQKGKWIINFK
ncbi:DNA-binding protein [Fusobacterium necrophorum subsp. funduliforme]|uniref:DNA-binding protein n=2 Tax=Fusobacterium necrophorum TaxID=859 RepID=A0A162JBJ4_9FUSO|nr:winged helix-turn-helix transcriptional regulator [Fusobacterium necrophorum]KYL05488.1 DNA-binding protein [Fusobacterium necrophorum subsp. funduliforme]KYM45403.1 DNA-binding protein [Fusobacterium necrophorum subsp. funduliforme]KYM60692.1 DNA-binding protein [Fusobacterium necrophorum subsp. funduliforme]KYM66316.1 DNA-binding protein [Fusobacterium necrophorum subsp. funduliforme]MDK4488121.1 winged helix-turn-helix transcriptional regulator [Fusobacterium necrophorum]